MNTSDKLLMTLVITHEGITYLFILNEQCVDAFISTLYQKLKFKCSYLSLLYQINRSNKVIPIPIGIAPVAIHDKPSINKLLFLCSLTCAIAAKVLFFQSRNCYILYRIRLYYFGNSKSNQSKSYQKTSNNRNSD